MNIVTPSKPSSARAGFTLVELSVVLVILALIIGGVMVGRDMLHAAKLRKLATDYEHVTTALNIFQEKFDAMPGDMTSATDFWGAAAGCPSQSSASKKQATCNGDGDGKIGLNTTFMDERFWLWQHLANAKLVSGLYSGVPIDMGGADVDSTMVPGENIYQVFDDIGIGLLYHDPANYTPPFANLFVRHYGNSISIGAQNGEFENTGRFLTARQAWQFDTKVDDGMPARGDVIGFSFSSCTTASGATDLDAAYLIDSEGERCAIVIPDVM